jgi:hypothetical protein
MTDAKLAPTIQEWQVEHTNLYLSSGGTDGAHNEEDPAGLLGNGRLLVDPNHDRP